MKIHFLTLTAHLLSLASAALTTSTTVRGSIVPQELTVPADTTVTLTTSGARYEALVRVDNSFSIGGVGEGSYILETRCATHAFLPLRVDVRRDGTVKVAQTFRGGPWDNLGEVLSGIVGDPLELRPVGRTEYLVVREGFNLMKMLGSPMMLLAIFGLGSVVLLPKLMDKLDPEFKAELEAAQKKRGTTAKENPLANFDMAGFLAGKSKPTAAPAQAQVQGGRRR